MSLTACRFVFLPCLYDAGPDLQRQSGATILQFLADLRCLRRHLLIVVLHLPQIAAVPLTADHVVADACRGDHTEMADDWGELAVTVEMRDPDNPTMDQGLVLLEFG